MEKEELIEKIKELAKLLKGEFAIIIYADRTWKQIGGIPDLMHEEINELQKNYKRELIDKILLLRQKLKK